MTGDSGYPTCRFQVGFVPVSSKKQLPWMSVLIDLTLVPDVPGLTLQEEERGFEVVLACLAALQPLKSFS